MRPAIRFLNPAQVRAARPGFREIYWRAFAAPPYSRPAAVADSFADSLLRHVAQDGFRCVVAVDEAAPGDAAGGSLLGFAYGYTTAPGQWWHDLVWRALGPERGREWLHAAFELVEFAVLPQAQGLGLGSRLHDTLLAGLPHRTAVLSTMQAETVALHLYRRRQWVVLLENFMFPGGSRPYLVMGRRLNAAERGEAL